MTATAASRRPSLRGLLLILVAAGIGALGAVGAPTSLAGRLAEESGLALYGFASPERCVRYA